MTREEKQVLGHLFQHSHPFPLGGGLDWWAVPRNVWKRALKRLVSKGYVQISRSGGSVTHRSNVYRLTRGGRRRARGLGM